MFDILFSWLQDKEPNNIPKKNKEEQQHKTPKHLTYHFRSRGSKLNIAV